MFIGNLPADASEQSVRSLFAEFGTVRSIHLISDVFSGKCKGFAFVEMEGHEARAAIAGLNGKSMGNERPLKVQFEEEGRGRTKRRR